MMLNAMFGDTNLITIKDNNFISTLDNYRLASKVVQKF